MELSLESLGQLLDKLLDKKLHPIIDAVNNMQADLLSAKNEIRNLRILIDAINSRLFKLENRVANTELKIDKVMLRLNVIEKI